MQFLKIFPLLFYFLKRDCNFIQNLVCKLRAIFLIVMAQLGRKSNYSVYTFFKISLTVVCSEDCVIFCGRILQNCHAYSSIFPCNRLFVNRVLSIGVPFRVLDMAQTLCMTETGLLCPLCWALLLASELSTFCWIFNWYEFGFLLWLVNVCLISYKRHFPKIERKIFAL